MFFLVRFTTDGILTDGSLIAGGGGYKIRGDGEGASEVLHLQKGRGGGRSKPCRRGETKSFEVVLTHMSVKF